MMVVVGSFVGSGVHVDVVVAVALETDDTTMAVVGQRPELPKQRAPGSRESS